MASSKIPERAKSKRFNGAKMKNEREQFLDVYETMSEESKSVFTPEQRKVIELQIGLRRLFNDPCVLQGSTTSRGGSLLRTRTRKRLKPRLCG